MKLNGEDIKAYVEYQEALGPVQGGKTLKFLNKEDLTENSTIQDHWLAALTERYNKHVEESKAIAALMKKIEFLEPMTVADFERLEKFIA